jgi:hypothetical protein
VRRREAVAVRDRRALASRVVRDRVDVDVEGRRVAEHVIGTDVETSAGYDITLDGSGTTARV